MEGIQDTKGKAIGHMEGHAWPSMCPVPVPLPPLCPISTYLSRLGRTTAGTCPDVSNIGNVFKISSYLPKHSPAGVCYCGCPAWFLCVHVSCGVGPVCPVRTAGWTPRVLWGWLYGLCMSCVKVAVCILCVLWGV